MLTAKSVESAKPGAKRIEIADAALPGHYLIIQPNGKKTWAVRYRHGRKTRKFTLGPYPALSLIKARDEAKAALQLVAKGIDPAAQKTIARQKAMDGRDLFKNVVAQFLEHHAKGKRSRPEIERMFKHDVLPRWGERRIQDITRRDVIELMDSTCRSRHRNNDEPRLLDR